MLLTQHTLLSKQSTKDMWLEELELFETEYSKFLKK